MHQKFVITVLWRTGAKRKPTSVVVFVSRSIVVGPNVACVAFGFLQAILRTLAQVFHTAAAAGADDAGAGGKKNGGVAPPREFGSALAGIVRGVGVALLKELLDGAGGTMPSWVRIIFNTLLQIATHPPRPFARFPSVERMLR